MKRSTSKEFLSPSYGGGHSPQRWSGAPHQHYAHISHTGLLSKVYMCSLTRPSLLLNWQPQQTVKAKEILSHPRSMWWCRGVPLQLKKAKYVSICGKPFSSSLGKRAQWLVSSLQRHRLQPEELFLGVNMSPQAQSGQWSHVLRQVSIKSNFIQAIIKWV